MRTAQITSSLTYAAILAAIWFPQDGYAAQEERFIPTAPVLSRSAHARVSGVERNGGLSLALGRVVQLEGIRLMLNGPARTGGPSALGIGGAGASRNGQLRRYPAPL
jgi:hypothetical protein